MESSPAAVLTTSSTGEILLANPSAHRLFGMAGGSLPGRSIAAYVPALASVPSVNETDRIFRTQMQTRGQRQAEKYFSPTSFSPLMGHPQERVWRRYWSTLQTTCGSVREASLEQLLAGSRILVAAVSHEVRNVCGAIGVMHENLSRQGSLRGNKDFDALGSLVETLAKIASLELKQSTGRFEPGGVDLHEF